MTNSTNGPTDLDLACQALREAKMRLNAAKLEVANAEDVIVGMIGTKGDEGTLTEKTLYFKASTTAKLTRSLDVKKYREIAGDIPGHILDLAIKYKPEINLTGLRAVEKASPADYRALAQAIITKPAKTSVSVELLEKKEAA